MLRCDRAFRPFDCESVDSLNTRDKHRMPVSFRLSEFDIQDIVSLVLGRSPVISFCCYNPVVIVQEDTA